MKIKVIDPGHSQFGKTFNTTHIEVDKYFDLTLTYYYVKEYFNGEFDKHLRFNFFLEEEVEVVR